MRARRGCIVALALTSLVACSALIHLSEASLLGSIKRPFSSTLAKLRNLRERAITSRHRERLDRIQGRSAGPVPAGGAQGPRVSNSRPPAAPNDTSAEFESKCFVSRGPNFKKPPTLHFYSTRSHGPQTLGCAATKVVTFELKPVEGDLADSPELNRSSIGSELVDTKLFDPAAPTYLIVHGFLSAWNSGNWMCNIKDLVLNNSRANVFIVDWSGGAKPMLPIDYSASVSNTQYVGALLGEFIKALMAMGGQRDARRYHLIGHSLGAHICGFAGYYVGSIGRITGLDPAGPCFGSHSSSKELEASTNGFLGGGRRRLSAESAEVVVALHTDSGLFGLNENCGHYDVFVNGGFRQPECAASRLRSRLEDILSLNIKDGVSLALTCSHSYAHELVNIFSRLLGGGVKRRPAAAAREADVIDLEGGLAVVESSESDPDRCYPMAYECADWDSFKAGECGFCSHRDPRCLYTGLSLMQYQAKKTAELDYKGTVPKSEEDDYEYNDEDPDLTNDDPDGDQTAGKQIDRFARGQHFMRSGPKPSVCVYQYQVVVATRRKDIEAIRDEGKYYFYLHLPLELSGRLLDEKAERLHDRLVQVSHKVAPDSTAYQLLQSNYLRSLRARGALPAQQTDVDF